MSHSYSDAGTSPSVARSFREGDSHAEAEAEAEPGAGVQEGTPPDQSWAVEAQLLLRGMDDDEPDSNSEASSESSYSGYEAEVGGFPFLTRCHRDVLPRA